ncbi:uncharacterized protein PGTG_07182 [Puccinia graminis f. sp. tritici CRL 75-36-700-3]|uniref:Choline/carnitine acyltransferase domain-containing protein n=1 Tax=Puccinia graminis f. sp. tritici (strain CRL 75-36-700-3 / race SCCL) TaxID=418459 RepID=E3K9Q6_PUCGT|nr:uncharacterized protein PGTG_07182 [Puccinia graminis f. sp. tritici CRL 75-36-700-3]EFP80930.2 hypothetical protein PGTG_07182 [Puccinia graminis f. sp. tritici CRL 75-36-700-3]
MSAFRIPGRSQTFRSALQDFSPSARRMNTTRVDLNSEPARLPELPRLPVPPLEQSANLYLRSIVPVLLQSSGADFEKEYERRQVWASQLCAPGGLGQRLQDRLIDIDRNSPNNWLDDNYWMKLAYHSARSPLPVNSNWWILLKHDRDIPAAVIESVPETGRFTDWQLRRAATLIHRFMIFKEMLDRQEIIPDSSRAARWQRHWMLDSLYGITRIPNKPHDHLNIPKRTARHILILARGHIYSLDILAPDHSLLPAKQIEASLWSIVNHVTLHAAAAPIGSLTGLDRDQWTDAREHLLSLSPTVNRDSLSKIEDGLFAVCLDDSTRPAGLQGHIRTASTNYDGLNRWFDKSFSFIVENNSRASVSGEHSPSDALIAAIITDFVLAEGVGPGLCDPSVKAASHDPENHSWKKLEWVTDQRISRFIQESKSTVEAISKDSDCDLLIFEQYGIEYIKRSARHSPDAYIQMAIQLAWFRQVGTVVSTYETGLTRLFKHGRTETIRTLSSESYAWVKAMDSEEDCHLVYNLFVQAISAHNFYTKQASLGRAFDRHFLGLRLQHRPSEDGALPELFTDPVFAESSEWQLSTSGISAGERFIGTGFGCFGKGYGINYIVAPSRITFGIETKHSDPRTSATQFKQYIAQALKDIRILCQRATGKIPHHSSPSDSTRSESKL